MYKLVFKINPNKVLNMKYFNINIYKLNII